MTQKQIQKNLQLSRKLKLNALEDFRLAKILEETGEMLIEKERKGEKL